MVQKSSAVTGFSKIHCSLVGPHLGTLVPIRTKIMVPIWSPFFFKVPIFFILGLRMRQKSVQPLSNANQLITCDNKNWFQKLSTGPNGDQVPIWSPFLLPKWCSVLPQSWNFA